MAIDDQAVLGVTPLFPEETEDAIAARYVQWANEGLTPEDVDDWTDVRPGSYWYLTTRQGIREDARIYDVMGTDFVAACFPLWSWGEYLDDIAGGQKIFRNAATPAKGKVTFTGKAGTAIEPGTTVAVEGPADQVEGKEYEVTDGGVIPEGGSIELVVEALTAGVAGNAPAGAVTLLQSELGGVEAVTNAEPIVGGEDPEDDESLRERLIEAKDGEGPGNQKDYRIWGRAFSAEIGRVVVIPLWEGPGTVLVIILTGSGDPVSAEIVDAFQAFLDPVAGMGEGEAPIGPAVTVVTAEVVEVDVAAKIEAEPGYSLDGAGGTIAIGEAVEAAIAVPIEASQPGGEVVLQSVVAAIMSITGVHDVGNVKLNGAAKNIPLSSDPAEVGSIGTVTLEAGAV
ncbi:MAG: baseplate J/gp47 family protein [Solirubrobacterales bacterium]